MAIINVSLQDTFAQWRIATNAIGDYIGSTATLTTTSQNLTGAINELKANNISDGILNTGGWPFKVQVDNPDTYEFELDAAGNVRISGTLSGNVTGNVTGDTTGTHTGPVTGDTTGTHTGPVTGAVTGNASTATALASGRTIAITGDATWSTTFNGAGNATGALTLANSGVVAGTWSKVTVDTKGRITTGALLAVGDVVTALGYTPWHGANDGSTSGLDADLLDGYNSSLTTVANTIPVRDASGDITTRIFIGTATSARFADLAEKYTTDKEYPIGTVIVVSLSDIGSEGTASFLSAQRVLGVVSKNPAYLMNSESTGQALALRGRVPVIVSGPIHKGQPLVSNQDGRAVYGDHQNSFAIALETNSNPSTKLVECVIL